MVALVGYEVVEAGLATHLVAAEKLGELEERLSTSSHTELQDHAHLERIFSSFQVQHISLMDSLSCLVLMVPDQLIRTLRLSVCVDCLEFRLLILANVTVLGSSTTAYLISEHRPIR